MTNVSAGTGIDVTHTPAQGSTATVAVDVSDFMSNGSNNYVVTATGADAMNAEANLTFDGSTLTVLGAVTTGVDGTGHEVKFFSDTSDGYMLYDDTGKLTVRNKNSSQNGAFAVYQEGAGKTPVTFSTSDGKDLQFYNDSNSWILRFGGQGVISTGKSGGSGANDQFTVYTNDGSLALKIDDAQQCIVVKSARVDQQALTSSSNAIAWDVRAKQNAYHLTTENTTFSAPTNAVEGAVISVEIAQGGTARTIAWNTIFEFAASTAPTITATASKTDILTFRYNGSIWQEIGRVQNMAQT
jgi:hypothetical protein